MSGEEDLLSILMTSALATYSVLPRGGPRNSEDMRVGLLILNRV